MPVAHTIEARSSYQPYQCLVCQSRFTRHENLKRHAALHTRSRDEASLSCDFCHATFSRPDLRHRHMKRKHPEQEEQRSKKRPRPQRDLQASSQAANRGRPRGENTLVVSPTDSHYELEPQCADDESELVMESDGGYTEMRHNMHQLNQDRQLYTEARVFENSTSLNTEEYDIQICSVPSRQQASMRESACIGNIVQDPANLEPPLLPGISFLEPTHHTSIQAHSTTTSQFNSSSTNLAYFDFDQNISDEWLSVDLPQSQHDWSPSDSQISRGCEIFFTHVSHYVPFLHQPTFDAQQVARHLLLSMLSLAYQHGEDPDCGDEADSGMKLSIHCFRRARVIIARKEDKMDGPTHDITIVQAYLLLQIYAMMYLCGKDSSYGLKTHSKMISLTRAGGLVQPILIESALTEDLDSLWREFIKAESHKRTLFAVHQIDTLWYQFLSIPRSLSHLEIKHDLPCPEDFWTASSSVEWAHRRLIAQQPGSLVQYSDAIRRFLSPDKDIQSIQAFDKYGAINLTQFLISSAREISGWSTMTGMISMERLEPLRSSLFALEPFIRSQPEKETPTQSALCEATWETAMIEMQMWSPSHTGGIVEGSVDAVLHQLTYLAPSCEFLCESNTAKFVQPHIDWFLRYLDNTLVPDFEAPWIPLYAYKAFMIAWQFLRAGLVGAMQVIDVPDRDTEGALMWARKVFRRRERWQLGKIIMECLDTLENSVVR